MNRVAHFLAISIATLAASPVLADLSVVFREGAPKDRFEIANDGSCDLGAAKVSIDLSSSASGVIFDVTGEGAGVEVFQPFQLVSGSAYVDEITTVADGERVVTLLLKSLPASQSIVFTTDLDDTDGGREITVTDEEIRGAAVAVQVGSWNASESFGDSAELTVPLPACL